MALSYHAVLHDVARHFSLRMDNSDSVTADCSLCLDKIRHKKKQ